MLRTSHSETESSATRMIMMNKVGSCTQHEQEHVTVVGAITEDVLVWQKTRFHQ